MTMARVYVDDLARLAQRWDCAAEDHERKGDRAAAETCRREAATVRARAEQARTLRSTGVRFG